MTAYDAIQEQGLDAVKIIETQTGRLELQIVDPNPHGYDSVHHDGETRGAVLVALLEEVRSLREQVAAFQGASKREKARVGA